MIELIQGPCEANQEVLVDTKTLDVCMRVLAWTQSDLKVVLVWY